MKLKTRCQVNTNLLSFKLHFFFVYGVYAGVMPFMPLIAKQLGINATAVGIGYSMIPIFIFITNPFIGFLVDFFQNIKVFLVVLLAISAASYFSVLSIPVVNHEIPNTAHVRITQLNESETVLPFPEPFEKTCLIKLLTLDIGCKLKFTIDLPLSNENEYGVMTDLIGSFNISYDSINRAKTYETGDNKFWVTFYVENISLPDSINFTSSKLFHCLPNIEYCLLNDKTFSVLSSYQFWAFITVAVIGAITSASVMTLSSLGCCEILGPDVEAYGRQRLFGTISWGLVCTLAGILNDIANSSEKSFLPGFYLMAIFFLTDIIIVFKIRIPKANLSSNMCKDLGKIFSSREILSFSFAVIFVGIFNSVIDVYEFWFLMDMGANQTLLGLAMAMQCLVGEVPFLFFSGWFVSKLGHFLCIVGVFSGFAMRLLCYSFIKNPWLVLPVDILHGLTYGLYHGTMTSFAKEKAPKGMEATLLGIFGGFYDGPGYGLGSFLGGFGLDNLGSRRTFLSSSMLSFVCVLIFLVISFVFRTPAGKKMQQVIPSENEESLL